KDVDAAGVGRLERRTDGEVVPGVIACGRVVDEITRRQYQTDTGARRPLDPEEHAGRRRREVDRGRQRRTTVHDVDRVDARSADDDFSEAVAVEIAGGQGSAETRARRSRDGQDGVPDAQTLAQSQSTAVEIDRSRVSIRAGRADGEVTIRIRT